MQITKTLELQDRAAWRAWLAKHYDKEKEIWLIYYKKGSGKERIPYNDAVEEALCFGWVDSTVKGIDDEKYAQRFSPRNPKTPYSETNKVRLRKLIKQKKVLPHVLARVKDLEEKFAIPPDIEKALKENKAAWGNFQKFPEHYQRIRVGFVEGARDRPDEFIKRLNYLVKMTAAGKQFGFGIQDYY